MVRCSAATRGPAKHFFARKMEKRLLKIILYFVSARVFWPHILCRRASYGLPKYGAACMLILAQDGREEFR